MEDLQIFWLLFLRARIPITLLALFRLQSISQCCQKKLISVLYFIILIIDLLQSLLDTWANK